MYKALISTIFILIYHIALGQMQKDFAYYNSETYRLYEEANWKELIPMANESIANGHDFYYMRMRLGIAYFQQEKYVQAKTNFEKSLEFDEGSIDAKSYLYYCLLHLGRKKEAAKFYSVDNEKPKFISSIYFEPGIKISDNKASVRNSKYFFLGLNHDIGKNVSLFHGYQRLAADFAYTITNSGGGGQGPGGGSTTSEYIYTVIQNEYYAALSILVAKGLYITPAVHLQGVSTEGFSGANNVLSVQLAKWFGKVRLYGAYYRSQINEQNQQQIEGGLVFYPMGNTNFYLQAQATSHTENAVNNMIWSGKGGLKLFPKTWLEASYTTGDMLNFSESNGYLLYNQLDVIKSKWGLGINQYLGKHLLYLGYIHESKEEFASEIPFAHHDLILGFNLIF
jgi:tetratricopeptide (TPR) repeat protein